MPALIAFVQFDVTLTAIAIGLSLRDRPWAATVGATMLGAAAMVLLCVFAWLVWFVAPACLAEPDVIACTTGHLGVGGLLMTFELALAEWLWTLLVALTARSVGKRPRVRITS